MQMQISNDDIELSLLPTITLTLAEIMSSSLSVGMRSSLGHSTVLFGMAPYVLSQKKATHGTQWMEN
jgi:high-affinity nickel permease